MKLKRYILTILLFWAGVLQAQDLKFTAGVNKTTVGVGERFEVVFSVNGNGENFVPPIWRGLQVLSGPNVSTSMESINGQTSVSNSISYILMATKQGEANIPAASITVNGNKLNTNPIKIKVIKGAPLQQNNGQPNGADASIIEGNTSDLAKSLFIKAIVDKSTVYQGQQIALSFRI
jgi:hypothetical protein